VAARIRARQVGLANGAHQAQARCLYAGNELFHSIKFSARDHTKYDSIFPRK